MPFMLVVTTMLILGCGGDPPSTGIHKEPLAPRETRGPTAIAAKGALKAEHRKQDGWGAVFWRNATAWKVGGGSVVVGPREAQTVRSSGEPLVCEGVAIKGAPKHGAVALPENSPVPELKKPSAIQAHRVERAAWRLDEVLPARGRYASKIPAKAPSKQRGIDVGSVTKTRRYGAPPFLIATGVRSCHGAVAFTDLKAEKTLAYDQIKNSCSPLRVLPALDYDGDGSREFAIFSDEVVVVYRITESPGRLSMTRLADWHCKATE